MSSECVGIFVDAHQFSVPPALPEPADQHTGVYCVVLRLLRVADQRLYTALFGCRLFFVWQIDLFSARGSSASCALL